MQKKEETRWCWLTLRCNDANYTTCRMSTVKNNIKLAISTKLFFENFGTINLGISRSKMKFVIILTIVCVVFAIIISPSVQQGN